METSRDLTESEKKYLIKFERNVKRIYLNYLTVGIYLCVAIVGLVMGIKLGRKEGFIISIISGGLAVILFLNSRKYQKLHKIISKLRQTAGGT